MSATSETWSACQRRARYRAGPLHGFGAELRRQREAAMVTQAMLSRCVGCAPSTITKLETGEREPSLPMAVRLAVALSGDEGERCRLILSAGFLPPRIYRHGVEAAECGVMLKKCSEPECDGFVIAKGLCSKHYGRMRVEAQKQAMGEPQGAKTLESTNGNSNGISREMYLIGKDAAAELGVTANVLNRMSKELGCGTNHGTVRTYTAKDIAKLRVLQGWMKELEVPPSLAAKIMRKVSKLKQSGAPLPGSA